MRQTAALMSILLVALMGAAAAQGVRSNRRLLQETGAAVTNETMTTKPSEMMTASAEVMNATTSAVNATNTTGNATNVRSRFAEGSEAPLPRCRLIECKKRKLLQTLAATASNETQAVMAEGMNATAVNASVTAAATMNATASGNVTGNATDSRSRRGGGNGDGWGGSRGSSPYGDRTAFGV